VSVKTEEKKNKPKLRIKVKSFDYKIIDECVKKIMEAAKRSGAIVNGPIPLPVKTQKMTVNRSTFVHGSTKDQYEIRTHKRLIDLLESTPKTMEILSTLDLPAGVDIEIKMI